MAKNTTKKSSKKKNGFFKKISSLKWYTKLVLLALVVALVFLTFKESVNSYNISLLDKAEAKMRQMDVPEADYTEYRRSCSFKSVKFGSTGSPNCDVWRTDIYDARSFEESYGLSIDYLNQYKKIYPNSNANYTTEADITQRLKMAVDESPTLIVSGMQEGLDCYVNAGIDDKLPTSLDWQGASYNKEFLIITTSCYRKFLFQTYPEI